MAPRQSTFPPLALTTISKQKGWMWPDPCNEWSDLTTGLGLPVELCHVSLRSCATPQFGMGIAGAATRPWACHQETPWLRHSKSSAEL
jgi:hypothetical protein